VYIHEAYAVLEAKEPEPTLDELLEAYEVLSVEKGYLLAILTRNLESCGSTEIQEKIWKLAFYIKVVNIKLNNKFNQLQK